MNRTYINEVQKEIGNTVKVQGFIENLRNSKYMAFIVLKDITGKLQITVEKEDHPDLVDTIDQLTPDSVITVTGKVVENDYVKMGGIEMIPEAIEVESIADALPIARKAIAATKKKKAVERSSIDQRIDYRWVDLRTDENQLMFKAQSCFVNAMRQFLLERNFIEIHTPKLIAAASESGSRCSRWITSTAMPIWHRAPSSTSRWQWLQALSAFSRPALCSAPRRAIPTSMPRSSPVSIWSSATSPLTRMSWPWRSSCSRLACRL